MCLHACSCQPWTLQRSSYVRIVVFSRPRIETAAPCSLHAARGHIHSSPAELEWQPGLRILSGLCTQLLIHVWGVWGAGEGSARIEEEAGGQKRAEGIFFLIFFFLSCTALSANSFWSHLFIFVRPQAVTTLVDIGILNSQSAYLENESQKEDKGRRSVKTGDESPSWRRNRLRPVWSGLVRWFHQRTWGKKRKIWN